MVAVLNGIKPFGTCHYFIKNQTSHSIGCTVIPLFLILSYRTDDFPVPIYTLLTLHQIIDIAGGANKYHDVIGLGAHCNGFLKPGKCCVIIAHLAVA